MMLLTATATKEVRADIRRVLRYERNDALESFIGSFNRTNLIYRVHAKPDKIKDQMIAVAQDIHSHHTIDACGILYVTSRKDAETLADGLNTAGISSRPYHAGLSDERRHQTHLLWRSNQIRVITATIAFGMGIDKADVRFVVHYNLPFDLESYYQEAGRGGRDGKTALAIAFKSEPDLAELQRWSDNKYPTWKELKTHYVLLCNYFHIPRESVSPKPRDFEMRALSTEVEVPALNLYSSIKILQNEGILMLNEDSDDFGYIYFIAQPQDVITYKKQQITMMKNIEN